MKLISAILVAVVVVIGVTFASLNAEKVAINLYFGTYHLQLSLLLVLTLGIGIVVGFLTLGLHYLRLKSENRRIKNHAKWIEKEVKNLRTMPLKDVP